MQKSQFLLATLLSSSTFIVGCQTVSPLLDQAKSTFNQTISPTKLDVDTIITLAYPKTLTEPMADIPPKELDDYFKAYPSKQLGANILGFVHPSIEYKNIQGEIRYLVIIEKVKIYDGYIQSCRACSSTADILIFKKQANTFVLVNSARDQTEIPSGNGHLRLNFKDEIQKNLQAFGHNMMGSYVYASFSGAGGQEESLWYALLLPEIGNIQALNIGSAGGSSANYYADRPEMASTITSTLKIINNQGTYYPIEVTYIDQKKPSKPYKSQFLYDQTKLEYIEKTIK